jgi:hypothetical protein
VTQAGPLGEFLHAARRRRAASLVLEQAGWALTAGLGGLCLLLIAGAQVFAWYWPALLTAGAAAWGAWRLWGRIPGLYQTAQEADRRLDLKDLLSSAWHVQEKGSDSALAGVLMEQAERESRGVRAEEASPFAAPRSLWAAAALLAVAAGLFALRYGVLGELAWSKPLLDMRFDPFSAYEKKAAKAKSKSALPDTGPEPLDVQASGPDVEDALSKSALLGVEDIETPGEGASSMMERKKGETGDQASDDAQGEEGENAGEPASSGKPGESDKDASDKGEPGKEPPPGTKEANSLLDKMRDAMASLLEKMKQQGKNEGKAPGKGKKDSGQSASDRTDRAGKKQGQGEKTNDPQEAQAGQMEQSEGQQSSMSNQPNEQESPDNNSGAGRSDGRKDTELAEQAEAMGKISEILGKRADKVQGEMMVEVNSTKQQLRTPFLNRQAAHGDTGGEIRRDEVPLHLQDYVQRYYEQVRKPAPKQ